MPRRTRVREHSRRNAAHVREHERELAPDPREQHARPTPKSRMPEYRSTDNEFGTDTQPSYLRALANGELVDKSEFYLNEHGAPVPLDEAEHSLAAYEQFTVLIGPGYHPDDGVENLVHGIDGPPTYTPEEAARVNAWLAKTEPHVDDVYEAGIRAMKASGQWTLGDD